MNDFYVYALLDPRKPGKFSYRGSDFIFEHEPFYIGKGCNGRIDMHGGEVHSKKRTRKINRIKSIFNEISQYPLKVKIMEGLFEDSAFETEIFLIKQIGRLDHLRGPLSNGTDGGEGAYDPSKETRQKRSNALLGKYIGEASSFFGKHHSVESRRKISDAHKGIHSGENNPFYGRKHSEEYKQKMADNFSGENNPMFGKKQTEGTRKKISLAVSGENNPFYGRKHSNEIINIIRNKAKIRWEKKRSEETSKIIQIK